jgi:hypothetical protein
MYKLTIKFHVSLSEVSTLSEQAMNFTAVKFENNVLTVSKSGNYRHLLDTLDGINYSSILSVVILKDN